MTYVVEVDNYPTPSGPAATLYACTGQGFTTKPTDTPALTLVAPTLKQPWLIRRDLFDKATTYGAIKSAKGQIVFNNTRGTYDYLLSCALDGREVRAYSGTEGAAYPSTFTLVGKGVVETVSFNNNNEVVLTLRDRLDILDQPLLTTVFAGNNSLPNGVEGVSTDIGGKQKPRVYGAVFNVTPYLVNTSKAIYQISDQSSPITAVYDRGVALTLGTTYASVAAMLAATPTASTYNTCTLSTGTYFRLGSTPAGTVTCDASTTETRAASLISQMAQDGGISSGDISSTDVTALNTANSAVVGVWMDGTRTALDGITELAGAVGAYVSFDSSNKLRMARLEAPSGSPVATLEESRIISMSIISTADGDKGIPPWQIVLGWKKIYTTQTDLAGSVPATQVALLKDAYRTVTVQDASIKTAHLLSPTLGTPESPINTCLTTQADASTEATRRLTLYKVGRLMYQVKAYLSTAQIAAIDLGNCITLTYSRFGLSGGKLLRVVGIEANYETGQITLRLWG